MIFHLPYLLISIMLCTSTPHKPKIKIKQKLKIPHPNLPYLNKYASSATPPLPLQ
jgi:hypothetical protein